MDKQERLKMVSAMEFIARQLNDEELFIDTWLTVGVADGDIPYGEMCDDEYYIEDANFANLMDTFLYLMHHAYADGSGLYCDSIISEDLQ